MMGKSSLQGRRGDAQRHHVIEASHLCAEDSAWRKSSLHGIAECVWSTFKPRKMDSINATLRAEDAAWRKSSMQGRSITQHVHSFRPPCAVDSLGHNYAALAPQ
eukprot:TRINITY_DN14509_c0_g1_i3.p2 TRINITY_DN14509_c0_g1~~TRINITY_DN14509_c0_g1_i3.p2  ORF type:complete len:104 (+),score=9.16 TRINITY_DN14509_c0_g1_i3:266-577(+)